MDKLPPIINTSNLYCKHVHVAWNLPLKKWKNRFNWSIANCQFLWYVICLDSIESTAVSYMITPCCISDTRQLHLHRHGKQVSAIGNMGLFITALVHVSTAFIHFGKLHHWTVCTSICSFFLSQYRDKSWHIPDLHFPVVSDLWDFLGKFSVGSLLLSQVRLMFLHTPFCKKCLSQIITFLTAKNCLKLPFIWI